MRVTRATTSTVLVTVSEMLKDADCEISICPFLCLVMKVIPHEVVYAISDMSDFLMPK